MAETGNDQASAPAYAGDVSPHDAWRLLAERDALLVDVRTDAEWNFVGVSDLAPLGKEPLCISWQTYPTMQVDSDFVAAVEREVRARGGSPATPLVFLCRSGARSRAAAIAMTRQGFAACYNLAGGFEGDRDSQGHRGQVNGWKAAGLPWKQG